MKANDERELSLSSVNKDCFSTHIFEETQFMGVTAYQNQQVGRREGGREGGRGGSGVGVLGCVNSTFKLESGSGWEERVSCTLQTCSYT